MLKFSKFDQIVIFFLLSVGLLTGFIIRRGDQVGMDVLAMSPENESQQISTQSRIQITFATALASVPDQAIHLNPPVSGQTTFTGSRLIFSPDTPLATDTTYTVTVAADIMSEQGRRLQEPFTWQFTTSHPRIVYLGWEEDSPSQIVVTEIDGSSSMQLTDTENGVLDFAVSPDGTQIVYAVFRTEVETDLWIMDGNGRNQRELLNCELAACSAPVWTPDSRRIIYERRNIPTPGAPPGAPRLWWLDVVTSASIPVFQDNQLLGLGAGFSDDGEWLSFVSPVDQGIQAFNLVDGSGILIPNQMGSPAVWTPGSHNLVMTNIQLNDDQWTIQLLSVDVTTEALTMLSGDGTAVDDSAPIWSPDGEWLAFGRKEARTAMGRQLWLMRPDGSDAHAITTNADVHHGPFAWSPDGRYLLSQQYALTERFAEPAIWLYDLETGAMREIASPGSRPIAWLP